MHSKLATHVFLYHLRAYGHCLSKNTAFSAGPLTFWGNICVNLDNEVSLAKNTHKRYPMTIALKSKNPLDNLSEPGFLGQTYSNNWARQYGHCSRERTFWLSGLSYLGPFRRPVQKVLRPIPRSPTLKQSEG